MEANPRVLSWALLQKPTYEPPNDEERSLRRLISHIVNSPQPGKLGIDRFTDECLKQLSTEQKNQLSFFASRLTDYSTPLSRDEVRYEVVDSLGVTGGRCAIDARLVSRRTVIKKNHSTKDL